MKILRVLLLIFGVIMVSFLLIAIFLPSKSIVNREIIIDKPLEEVFNNAEDLNNFAQWNPWITYEKQLKTEVSSKSKGSGSKFSWDGDTIGTGYLQRISIQKNKQIESDMVFLKPWEAKSKDIVRFESQGNKTKVTWTNEMDLPYPIGRYMGLAMDEMIGRDLTKGLESLKKFCENIANTFEISLIDLNTLQLYYINDNITLSPDAIQLALGKNYSELMEFISKNSIKMAGAPIAINNKYDQKTWNFDAAVPVIDNKLKASGRIKSGKLSAGKALKLVYIGPYSGISQAYIKLQEYMSKNNIKSTDKSFEEYVSDPSNTPQDKLITNIYWYIK